METDDINAARIEAARAFAEQRHFPAQNASFDALFVLAYLERINARTRPRIINQLKTNTPAPQWFVEAVNSDTNGKPKTAREYLEIQYSNPNDWECAQAGAWLRHMGFTSRKSNGRLIFER